MLLVLLYPEPPVFVPGAGFFKTESMKKLLYLFLLLSLPCLSFGQIEAKHSYYYSATVDTLGASDTLIIEFEHTGGQQIDFEQTYDYNWIITADSLSGANDGTVYLQTSNSAYGGTDVWYNAGTTTIDGTTTQTINYTGTLLARRLRVYFLTPSGAKSIRINAQGLAKRKNYK